MAERAWHVPIGRIEPLPGEAVAEQPLARRVDLAAASAGVALRAEGRGWRLEAGGLPVTLRTAGGFVVCGTAGVVELRPAAADRSVDGRPVGPALAELARLAGRLGMAWVPAAWLAEPEPAAPWERSDEHPYSMGWRMGWGEDYMMDFRLFWRGMGEVERASYLDRRGAPAEWREAARRWK